MGASDGQREAFKSSVSGNRMAIKNDCHWWRPARITKELRSTLADKIDGWRRRPLERIRVILLLYYFPVLEIPVSSHEYMMFELQYTERSDITVANITSPFWKYQSVA